MTGVEETLTARRHGSWDVPDGLLQGRRFFFGDPIR